MNQLIRTVIFFACVLATTSLQAASWSYGKIDIVESYSAYVMIRWDGANTESCGSSNNFRFDATSLGSDKAFDRAFSMVLMAAASGNPIRVHLDGCNGIRQEVDVVQICTNDSCTFQ